MIGLRLAESAHSDLVQSARSDYSPTMLSPTSVTLLLTMLRVRTKMRDVLVRLSALFGLAVVAWLLLQDAPLAATITAVMLVAGVLRPPSLSYAPPPPTPTTSSHVGMVPPPAEPLSDDASCTALRAGLPLAALDGVLQTFLTEATHRAYYDRDATVARLRALNRAWEGVEPMYEQDGARDDPRRCGFAACSGSPQLRGNGDAPPRDRIVISYKRDVTGDDPAALCFKFDVTLNAPMRCVLALPREIDLTSSCCSLLNIGEMLEYAPPIVAPPADDKRRGAAAAAGARGFQDARAPSCGVLRLIIGIAMPFPLPHAALRLRMLFHDCAGVAAADDDFDDYGGGGGGEGDGATAAERRDKDGGAPLALVLISEPSPIPPLTLSWGAIEIFVWCRPLDGGRRCRFVIMEKVRVPVSFPDVVVRFFIQFVVRSLVPTIFAGIVAMMPTITAPGSSYAPRMAADPVWYDFVANRSAQPNDTSGPTTTPWWRHIPGAGGGAGGDDEKARRDAPRPSFAEEEVVVSG